MFTKKLKIDRALHKICGKTVLIQGREGFILVKCVSCNLQYMLPEKANKQMTDYLEKTFKVTWGAE